MLVLFLLLAIIVSVVLALIVCWVLCVDLQRLPLSGEIAPLQQRRDHRLAFGSLTFESNPCNAAPDNASGTRDRKNYLLRVMALTGAARVGDGCAVDVGASTFQVSEGYINRRQVATGAKPRYEQTCYFCLNKAIPAEEQIATALLMLKNNQASQSQGRPILVDNGIGKEGASRKHVPNSRTEKGKMKETGAPSKLGLACMPFGPVRSRQFAV